MAGVQHGQRAEVGQTTVRTRKQRTSDGRRRGSIKIRFIKMPDGTWKRFARHMWEMVNGPLPAGHRVYHLDGDNLNDDPDNLASMTPGEWIKRCHEMDPAMSEDNRRGSRIGHMVKFNQTAAAVRRQLEFLPNYWYRVDDELHEVVNKPFKSRRMLAEDNGYFGIGLNGVVPKSCKIKMMRGRDLNADDQRRHYKKVGNQPCVKTRSYRCPENHGNKDL